MMPEQFIIEGGVFTDTTFTKLDPSFGGESYGPFTDYKVCLNVWRGKMGNQIDNCLHRLRIRSISA